MKKHLIALCAITAAVFSACAGDSADDFAGEGPGVASVASSDAEVPESLRQAMSAQREQLVANTTVLVRGEEQSVEKVGETLVSGPFTGVPTDGYDLYIKTGTPDRGGTNARVYVTIWSAGSGQWVAARYRLDHPNRDDFERGRIDDFHPRGIDLGGKVDYIYVEHDNSGDHPGWYLEKVDTVDVKRGQGTKCFINRWLATSEAPWTTSTQNPCSP